MIKTVHIVLTVKYSQLESLHMQNDEKARATFQERYEAEALKAEKTLDDLLSEGWAIIGSAPCESSRGSSLAFVLYKGGA